jgi:LAO/AO transport system kinase
LTEQRFESSVVTTSSRPSAIDEAAAMDDALLADILCIDPVAQRRAVAKAITLLESTRADHRLRSDALLMALPQPREPAFRIGISGVPGVGKSTFIEALGLHLIGTGHRIAVLAVDPSSSLSGGSILGDKTRMERLSVDARAFVRPSPSGGTLGGVAAATREAIRVVEAAGYGVVIVETVGVGQSEAAVAGMTDMFVLLQLPNAGDDLQAIKKGVMELADLVVVNKADLDAVAAARAVGQIASALHLVGQRAGAAWSPKVLAASALDAAQVGAVWQVAEAFRAAQEAGGGTAERRRSQSRAWLWERIDAGLRLGFRSHPEVRKSLAATLAAVDDGRLPVSVAARQLLAAFGGDGGTSTGHE